MSSPRLLLSILLVAAIQGQLRSQYCNSPNHIPPCHTHDTSICYGYAMGRAFGFKVGDATCNPAQLYADRLDDNAFTYVPISSDPTLTYLHGGDILAFGTRSGQGGHAAFVRSVPTSTNDPILPFPLPSGIWDADLSTYDPDQILLDQVPYQGGAVETCKTLTAVKLSQGNPVGYYHIKDFYKNSVTWSNSFSSGLICVGKDKFGNWKEQTSGITINFFPADRVDIYAQDGQSTSEGGQTYAWRYQSWSVLAYGTTTQNPQTVVINQPGTGVAYFKKQLNLNVQNCAANGNIGGTVKVASQVRDASESPFVGYAGDAFSLEAVTYQVINQVEFTFSNWGGGVANPTNPVQTFYPTVHSTYTANFNAKPLPPSNLSINPITGSPVTITWASHPSASGVTEYQIWRKVKPKNLNEGSPVLLSTVSRTTSSYTDYDYTFTSGYTDDLVSYDVRAHYVAGSTSVYADPNYLAAFATDNGAKPVADQERFSSPINFSVSAYPNPFNPATTITYSLIAGGHIRLAVFDLLGREVEVLSEGMTSAGYRAVLWKADGHPSGTYICRLKAVDEYGRMLSRSVRIQYVR